MKKETKQPTKLSDATQRKTIFKKYKQLIGSYLETANFKEPIALLMRRSRKVDFYENVTQGEFEFEHSDGTQKRIMIKTQFQQDFDYGKKTFKGYILHEDYPTPLPEDPIITNEMISIAIDKTLNDIKKWKAEEIKAQTNFWKTILWGIAILGIVYILYKLLIVPPSTPQQIAQAIINITQNQTETINQSIQTIGKITVL